MTDKLTDTELAEAKSDTSEVSRNAELLATAEEMFRDIGDALSHGGTPDKTNAVVRACLNRYWERKRRLKCR